MNRDANSLLPAFSRPPQTQLMFEPAACAELTAAWERTAATLVSIRSRLSEAQLPSEIRTIYVVGSLGRMEQLPQSDCDMIVVLSDDVSPRHAAACYDLVWSAVAAHGLRRPKTQGIYSQPTTCAELCRTGARGQVAEQVEVFGKRIQLLLESQPLYGDKDYRQLLQQVLGWYSGLEPAAGGPAQYAWQYLLHDLQRYYRALCVRTQWIADSVQWRYLNVKLRHSRRLAYCGLLLLLAASVSSHMTWMDWMVDHLPQTPLERVVSAYSLAGDAGCVQVAQAYERFLSFLKTVPSERVVDEQEWVQLLGNGSLLGDELQRFLWTQMSGWPAALREQFLV